jgi:RimJ/RimL family protein N-acetyltransferase
VWNKQNYGHGHGLWVIETHDGQFVGDCRLTIQDIEGEPFVEVGYHVHLALRGQGLATEAAIAVREASRAAGVPSSWPSSVPRIGHPSGWRRRSGSA